MADDRPLFIPVILGAPRQGRLSEHAAALVHARVEERAGVTTELIDVATLPIPVDDAGEAAKDEAFAEAMNRADGLVIVAPEYNHGYPGLLKHVLDTNLKEYIHKAAGVVGVSAGVFGGARVIQNLIPRLARARARADLLGRQLHTLRREREASRRVVPAADRQVHRRADLDGD